MSEKGKPDWTRHDFGAFNDQGITKLRIKHGMQGYGAFWFLIERLGESHNHRINLDDIDALAFASHLPSEWLKEFIADCCRFDLLILLDNEISSGRLDREMSRYYDLSQIRARAGKKGGKQKASNSQANAKQMSSQHDTLRNDTGRNDTNQQKERSPFENQFNQELRQAKTELWSLYVKCNQATKSSIVVTEKAFGYAFDRRNPTDSDIDAIRQFLTGYATVASRAGKNDFVPHLPAPDRFFQNDHWTAALPGQPVSVERCPKCDNRRWYMDGDTRKLCECRK